MTTTRAKFRCHSVEQSTEQPVEVQRYSTGQETTGLTWPRTFKFTPQYDPSVPEDQRYAQATPSGSLQLHVDNPNVAFTPGTYYYLDIIPVDEQAATATERAQRAYAAYGHATGGLTFDGRPMPAWDDLGETIQQAWTAAAQA